MYFCIDILLFIVLYQNSELLSEIIQINLLTLSTGVSITKAKIPVRTGMQLSDSRCQGSGFEL